MTTATDPIQVCVGAFGRYQVWLCFLIFLSKIFVSVHQLAIVFLNPPVKYMCLDTMKQNGCPCNKPQFDKSIFEETITTKWQLICGLSSLGALNQTMFQFGTLIGSITYGILSDRFGRKWPMVSAVIIQTAAGSVAAFVPDYYSFTILRFIVGVSVGGTMVIGFVILAEFVAKKHLAVLAAVYQMPFNFGHMMLSPISYFFRNVRGFQLGCSAPLACCIIYIFFLPETPRWLIAMRRTKEAIAVLENAAKFNNLPTSIVKPMVLQYQKQAESQKLRKGTIVDLFKTPNIRRNIMAISTQWLACSYSFYGISQYVGSLSGNIFLNNFLGAFCTLIGVCFSIPMMMYMGRRTIVILCNLICALSLLVLAFMPVGMARVSCAIVGQCASFVVFVLVYLYTSELFPTVVRNASMGYSSMLARVGSMIAPFVVDTRSIHQMMPPLLFGIVPLVAAIIAFLLPETKGHNLMTTIAEGEAFKAKSWLNAKVIIEPPPPKGFLEWLMFWRYWS